MQSQRAVRDDRWKLIVYPGLHHRQLFDLTRDPLETADVAELSDNAPHVARLEALMRQWQADVGDTLVLPTTFHQPEPIDLTGHPREPDQWQPEWIVRKYFGLSGASPR
jgi:arylsulfatase A-like enzyme